MTRAWLFSLLSATLVGCAGDPPPEPVTPPAPSAVPAAPPEEEDQDGEPEAYDDEPPVIPQAEAFTPSTASYEQAMATPEPTHLDDDRTHLTDNQLNGPMRSVLQTCKVPPYAKVTIRTAVQFGHAIGVTVVVDMPKPRQAKAAASAKAPPAKPPPPSGKPPKKAKDGLTARNRAIKRITTCADRHVRALTWPPSRRRDGFTTTF